MTIKFRKGNQFETYVKKFMRSVVFAGVGIFAYVISLGLYISTDNLLWVGLGFLGLLFDIANLLLLQYYALKIWRSR